MTDKIQVYLKIIIFIFISIFSFYLHANDTKIDSLKNLLKNSVDDKNLELLLELSEQHLIIDTDKAISYAKLAKKNSIKMNNIKGEVNALNKLSAAYWEKGLFNESFNFAKEAYILAEQIDFKEGLFRSGRKISNYYDNNGNYVLAEEYINKSIIIAKQLKDNEKICYIIAQRASLLNNQSKFEDAKIVYNEAIKIGEKYNLSSLLLELYSAQAMNIYNLGELDSALEYTLKGLEVSKLVEFSIYHARVYNDLGTIYLAMRKHKKSEENFLKALEIADKFDSKYIKTIISLSYANLLSEIGEFDKALNLYDSLLKSYEKTKGRVYYSVLINSANLMANQQKYNEALKRYLQGLEYHKKLNEEYNIALIKYNIGCLYSQTDNNKLAIEYLIDSKELYLKLSSFSSVKNVYKRLIDAYEIEGDFLNAYSELQEFDSFKDSLNTTEVDKIVAELETKLDAHKKEKEIESLENEKKVNSLKLKQNRFLLFSLTIFIIMLAFIIIIIIRNLRMKSKDLKIIKSKNQEIKFKNEEIIEINYILSELNDNLITKEKELKASIAAKNRLFSIIGHDLKNPIQAFISISEILKYKHNTISSNEILDFSNYISEVTYKVLGLLENLLLWSRAMNKNFVIRRKRISILSLININVDLYNVPAAKKNIEIINDVPNEIYVFVDANMISTVFRNLINNAIKFSKTNGFIRLYISKIVEDFVTINIEDNGVGIAEDKISYLFDITKTNSTEGTNNESGTGFGLILCKEFVDKNNGELFVNSDIGKGSTFSVRLPIYKNSKDPIT